jgi:hypothetical protein
MPVSDVDNLAPILHEVVRLNPSGILDLGIGFGKMGVLCREVLDAVHGRCQVNDWRTIICGVEGFESYENPAWGAYTKVTIADFRTMYEKVVGWPLVMLIDSLEHLERPEADVILRYLVVHNKQVIVSVPVGECPQEAVFGNEFERHRATYQGPKDFESYTCKVLHNGVCCVVSIKGEYQGGEYKPFD